MVTDRINLDKQIRDNFINTKMRPHRAKTGKGLIEILFSTIFQTVLIDYLDC